MPKTIVSKGDEANPTASDSTSPVRRIRENESDGLVMRLKQVIGDRKLTWFASESGVGESTLRNILAGAWPRTDILMSLAEAGGVTLDWLATGREPRTRAELRAAATAAPVAALDTERLKLAIATVEEGLSAARRVMAPDKKAELVLAVYDLYQEPAVSSERVLKIVKSAA